MNSRQSLYDINEFYKKGAVLYAGYRGMRYRIAAEKKDEQDILLLSIWPEPLGYEATDDNLINNYEYPFTEESLDDIYDFLCKTYEENFRD